MTKRAKYVGGYADGVDIVYLEDGDVYREQRYHVVRNGLLDKDAPAALRDELLSREDWTEVQDPADARAKSDDKPAGTDKTAAKDGDA